MADPISSWDHWYRRVLPAYWIFLFAGTHFPRLEAGLMRGDDKIMHFVAFGLLAFLFWRCVESFRRPLPLPRRFVWFAAILLAAYAAFDEYLQQFVGRSMDIRDWLCDCGGIVLALGWLELFRMRRARRLGSRGAGELRSVG